MKSRYLVGIGNYSMGDDGIGLRIAEHIAQAKLNSDFDVIEIGNHGLDLLSYLNEDVVEAVHSAYEGVRLIDELLRDGIKEEKLVAPTKFGTGSGLTEVPRGILFHHYSYDKDGICTGGDCIIPTNQNHANIQRDFEALVPKMLADGRSEKEMELHLEMLVRAYDPCISCSTHYLDVQFKK